VYDLPEGKASLVFGRSSKATLVFEDPLISARHCQLTSDGRFWFVKDLGTEAGTTVNERPISYPRTLFDGDRVRFGGVELTFRSETPTDDPVLKRAIAQNPDATEPWLVYADWLLERGDPLGERVTPNGARARSDDGLWLGSLWDRVLQGELEIDWHHGMVRRAAFRRAVGRVPFDWQDAVSLLLRTRVAQFLRELTIDLPRLRTERAVFDASELIEAQRYLVTLPWPPTFERLSLGYVLDGQGAQLAPIPELVRGIPTLREDAVFVRGRLSRLRLVSTVDGARVTGLEQGHRPLTAVTRIRRDGKGTLHFESPPGIPFIADGNPCYFALHEQTWRLFAGRLRGELRVNQRVDAVYDLLPGDLIEIQSAGRLRFEVIV
jgi:uncharacterized protein (TIGR02996 family)